MTQLLQFLGKIKLGTILPYIMVGLVFWYMQSEKNQNREDLIQFATALQDSVKVTTDKYGDKVAEISQIKTQSPNVFLNIKTNDADILRLQEEVKKYKDQIKDQGSVTVFNSSVKVDTTLAVTVKDDRIEASSSDGQWYSIKNTIVPGGISTTSLAVKNDYTVAVVEEDGKNVVKVKNKNPYATEGEIRTYANLPKQDKKISLGVGVGYDPIDGKMRPELQLHYNLITIK